MACGGTDDASVDTSSPSELPANIYPFTSGEFTLEGGEEKFLCYAITVEEDMTIDEFSFPGVPHVHHLIISEATAPEPDGMSECDILFRTSWLPLFIAGTGESNIVAPEGSGFEIKAGTQLVMQMHLLNVQPTSITDSVTVNMHKTDVENLDGIGILALGSLAISLPPQSQSEVVGSCVLEDDWNVFAVFPHMHYKGLSMVVEAGPTEDSLEEVFRRDPYDFDDQRLDSMPIDLPKGHHVRVTCQFDNNTDDVITFGESSTQEMCFFLVYAPGVETDLGGCLSGDGGSFLPEGCGDEPPNNLGIGTPCTPNGGECTGGLSCSADFMEAENGFCLTIGQCNAAADCGDGEAMCCMLDFGDNPINMCLPKGCGLSPCTYL